MGQRGRLIGGAAQLALGHGTSQLLGLARNFLVARLLTPEDFGVAAAFAATIAVVEATTEVGLDKYLIQSRRGDELGLQRAIHGLMAARGLVVALIVLLASGPVSALFGAPDAAPAFACIALVPLLRGLAHTDVKRLQRGLAFRREAASMVAAQLAGLAVAVGLALLLRSYWAMLFGVLAHTATHVAATHAMAERRYGLGIDVAEARGALAFGWPLTLNGALLAASAQGDRVVVGAALGVGELGLYAAAGMLIHVTVSMCLQVVSGVGLPWLSAAQGDTAEFRCRYGMLGVVFALVTAAAFPPFIVVGGQLVELVFGATYRSEPALTAWLAFGGAVRFLRGWQVTAGLAMADTKGVLIGNALRPVGLFFALGAASEGWGAVGVAVGMALGECVALVATAMRIGAITGAGAGGSILSPAIALSTCCALALGTEALPSGLQAEAAAAALATVFAGAIALGGTRDGKALMARVLARSAAPTARRP